MLLYYISGFGYGHLTRSLAVVEALLELDPKLQIILRCHPAHIPLALEYLHRFTSRVEATPFVSQFQIIFDNDKWKIDEEATRAEVLQWVKDLSKSVAAELQRIPGKIETVVSDIVPEAFAVAQAAGVPGIAVSNYTWYEVAQGFCGSGDLDNLRQLYQQATLLLKYELSTGASIPIHHQVSVGLLCRPFNPERVSEIRRQFKREGRPLVFLSVGGVLRIERIGLCADYDYIYTRGIDPADEIVAYPVPLKATDTQNYLAACDAVITKCGWSTVAEALSAKKPLFVVRSANGWVEEVSILQKLREWHAAVEIDPSELPNMSCKPLFTPQIQFENNVSHVAMQILRAGNREINGELIKP